MVQQEFFGEIESFKVGVLMDDDKFIGYVVYEPGGNTPLKPSPLANLAAVHARIKQYRLDEDNRVAAEKTAQRSSIKLR